MEWIDNNRMQIEQPKRPKRLTGTRFAAILGLDRWTTPFEVWCAVTRTYEKPFVDTVYTIAGKTIEPKIIDYLNKVYFFGDLKSPTDIYGEDYFKKTWGNFFPNEKFLGGMWDALYYEDGKISAVIEIKTTKRAEDWTNGAPDHYALQAALYAYLLGVDNVVMVCAFLEEKDYDDPDAFVPSASNTIIDEFKVSERYPQFQAHIDRATEWWEKHVVTGISPPFDEKKDADILKELRKNVVESDDDITSLIVEGETLKSIIDKQLEDMSSNQKRLDEIKEALKKHCMDQFRDGDTKVVLKGEEYEWILSKTEGIEVDKKALKADGLLDKYSKPRIGYRFTQSLIKEDTT